MIIPEGVIFIWGGTVATIPVGWQRETALDGLFAKACAEATDPNEIGGNATHTHTSPEHTHTMQSHTHTGNTPGADTSGTWGKDASNEDQSAVQDSHSHSFTSDGPTGGDLHDAISYQSINHEPPHRKVIFIKPSTVSTIMKANIIGLFDQVDIPTSWHICDGADDSIDLRDRYLKGASAGANADVVTDLGALTHTHTVDHTHTDRSHLHYGTTGNGLNNGRYARRGSNSGSTCNSADHTHSFNLPSKSVSAGAYTGTVTSETVEPLFRKLLAIQNTGGLALLPKKIIGLWLGLLEDIPGGWELLEAMNGYHVKIANDTTEIGNTGGANTHTHALSNSHTHAGASHVHDPAYVSQVATPAVNPSGGGYKAIQANHVHTNNGDSVVNSANTAYDSAQIEADESNNEPPYRTVAFIQLISGGGSGIISAVV